MQGRRRLVGATPNDPGEMAPSGMAPSGMAPSGMESSEMSPSRMSPSEHIPPSGMQPSGVPPSGMMAPSAEMSPSSGGIIEPMPPSGMPPSGQPMRAPGDDLSLISTASSDIRKIVNVGNAQKQQQQLLPPDSERTFGSSIRSIGNSMGGRSEGSVVYYLNDEETPVREYLGEISPIHEYLNNSSDEDNNNDQDLEKHDLLPSVDDARIYAAKVLRDSQKESDLALGKSDGIFITGKKGAGEGIQRLLRMMMLGLVLFFVLFFVFAGIVAMIRTANSDNSSPMGIPTSARMSGMMALIESSDPPSSSSSSSSRYQDIVDFLSLDVSDRTQLSMSGTPQYYAARWIADFDQEQRDIPKVLLSEDPTRFVQRYVLAVLYFAMTGDEWHRSLKFLTDEDECAWYMSVPSGNRKYAHGVTCNGVDLLVKELFLPANNLKGSIPSEIRHLSHLDLLSLSHNFVSGTIPNAIQELSLLQYLDVGYNNIVGTIPYWIGDELKLLQLLGLSNNNISGTIPRTISSLNHLKTLSLEKNQIHGNIASTINELVNLNYLYLGYNLFDDIINDQFLYKLNRLYELDVSNNILKSGNNNNNNNGFPIHLLNHPTLNVLDVSNNLLSGNIPNLVDDNYALKFLSFRGNSFTGVIPQSISLLSKLTHLDIEHNAFTGIIPAYSIGSSMKDLTYLFLGRNAFLPGPIPHDLSNLHNIRELSLASSQRIGEIPNWFKNNNKNLNFLDLQSNDLNGTIPAYLWGGMSELKYLLLNDNLLDGKLPENYTNIEKLAVVALHKNNMITGSANPLCEKNHAVSVSSSSSLRLFTINCDLIHCKKNCCPKCCWESNSNICFDDMLLTTITNSSDLWEKNYIPASASFNPSSILQ